MSGSISPRSSSNSRDVMTEDPGTRRTNQARRTRKALLEAAARLMKQGGRPTFEEVAEEALVSRATAYRYFSGVEPLLVEAALDLAMPGPTMFDGDSSTDPVARLERADDAVHAMIRDNEGALRTMLIHSLHAGLDGARFDRLARALALIIGTESMVAFKDVLRLDDDEADEVRRWMISALVEAAQTKGS
jgi:AcrR family transcriptional regulator